MRKFDYIIVGSGLAGLYAAYKASAKGSVAVITKSFLRESNSFNAQGGIAAVTSRDDNPEIHKSDTLIAGRGLCEDRSVEILVNEGPDRIAEIIAEGMEFDTVNGVLALGLEGGHHKRRILHAGGDATGRWITEFAIKKVLERDNISIFENTLLLDLLVSEGECYGVRCWSENEALQSDEKGSEVLLYANHVFLTSGGASAVYARTTNPQTTIGDGLAIAYKSGCRILDMEFIQFHPSGLYLKDSQRAFLISEAVRGERAHLLDKNGKRFMVPIHELAELAPRDIVARSIYKQMQKDGMPYVTLSLKHLDKEMILQRFPGIYAQCKEFGYDLTQEIPVAPAAHYSVGGVMSNNEGRTDVKRLYVCGEVAATGIMGANRLASNSLIECLVFASRAVEDSVKVGAVKECPHFDYEYTKDEANAELYARLKEQVSEIMNSHAGIIRSEEGLKEGLKKIEALSQSIKQRQAQRQVSGREYYLEASRRLLCVARLIMSPALLRQESRGGHYREDFPCADEAYALHSVQRKGEEITTAPVNSNFFNF
ncbi:MAG: L-aspartate oxidase [Alistipes sp.]|nr:L-aspartate oxidase [Alistipes sp.]MBR3887152.1 L-aspartate oxidase [Alistipes sp.]